MSTLLPLQTHQIVSRKPSKEPQEVEAANQLMDQVASALLETAGAVLNSPNAEEQLSYEGSMEEFGRRLVGVIVQFAELHWSSVASVEKKHIIMQVRKCVNAWANICM